MADWTDILVSLGGAYDSYNRANARSQSMVPKPPAVSQPQMFSMGDNQPSNRDSITQLIMMLMKMMERQGQPTSIPNLMSGVSSITGAGLGGMNSGGFGKPSGGFGG